jgi:hypothetical protein
LTVGRKSAGLQVCKSASRRFYVHDDKLFFMRDAWEYDPEVRPGVRPGARLGFDTRALHVEHD